MDLLRQHVDSLGFANIQSFIQSGNVLFKSTLTNVPKLESMIEDQLLAVLGFSVATFIRTDQETKKIAHFDPFSLSQYGSHSVLYISFLKTAPSQTLKDKLTEYSSEIEALKFLDRQLFWLWHREAGESKMTNARVEKNLGMPTTQRNSSTVRKLVKSFFENAL